MVVLTTVLYHAIADVETDFERGLDVVTRPEKFAAQIEYFSRNYDIVDLQTVLHGKLPQRPLLITFDDFYQSVLTAAREFLKPKRIPSLFFVNPALLGGDNIGLDNVLAFCVNCFGIAAVSEAIGIGQGAAQSLEDLIANVASTWSSAERARIKDLLLRDLGPKQADMGSRMPIVDPSELSQCAELGIEIGNHTNTHVHGRSLTQQELQTEIVASREKLEALSGAPVRSFSLPYGSTRDLSPAVLKAVRDSGHEAVFLVHARSNRFRMAPDIWYRTSLHNEDTSELGRKLTVAPLLRSAKHLVFG